MTNPDAPDDRHTIRVRYRGKTTEAMPLSLLSAGGIDAKKGFLGSLQTPWFLMERRGGACRATGVRTEPQELEGLYEQIGRNTDYIIHPEEILAENFTLLAISEITGQTLAPRSPLILERMRAILFQ